MKYDKYIQTFILLISMFFSFSLLAQETDGYRLATDDQISVTVYNEPELTLEKIRISTSGTISLPLIGQVVVATLTVEEAEKKLNGLFLDGYLKKPNVSVSIIEYRPFYIGGEVQRPGSYPYRKGLTIQKAVTIAGGFTTRASESGILLENEEGSKKVVKATLFESVQPGDVITVSESFF